MKLYFVRHGQTDFNASLAKGEEPSAGTDEPLNEVGISQAESLAKELRDIRFDAIVSSTLVRARQTAMIINQYHQLPIDYRSEWRERESNLNLSFDTWHNASDFDKQLTLEGLEPLGEFYSRIEDAYLKLIEEFKGKTVLLVAHGGVWHVINGVYNNLPRSGNIRRSPMANGEFRILKIDS